jgi:FkbM family methyltransferase
MVMAMQEAGPSGLLARLDYPRADIRLLATNGVERGFRAHACEKEPWTVDWLESLPTGSVLWDVGANVGSYTLVAAALGHSVVAVEPSFANYARLCQNLALNPKLAENVTALPVALDHASRLRWFALRKTAPGAAGHGWETPTFLPAFTQPVLCYALDDLIDEFHLPAPTAIKVDVDGGEEGVVMGVTRHLAQCTTWMIEMNDAEPYVTEELEVRGFRLTERHDARGIWYARFDREAA